MQGKNTQKKMKVRGSRGTERWEWLYGWEKLGCATALNNNHLFEFSRSLRSELWRQQGFDLPTEKCPRSGYIPGSKAGSYEKQGWRVLALGRSHRLGGGEEKEMKKNYEFSMLMGA